LVAKARFFVFTTYGFFVATFLVVLLQLKMSSKKFRATKKDTIRVIVIIIIAHLVLSKLNDWVITNISKFLNFNELSIKKLKLS
jgi:hypothetical protein